MNEKEGDDGGLRKVDSGSELEELHSNVEDSGLVVASLGENGSRGMRGHPFALMGTNILFETNGYC